MKHTLVMIGLTAFGIIGSFVYLPFVGLALYIFFAVLRPQYLWYYQLPQPQVPWSFYLAVAVMMATVIDTFLFARRTGLRSPDAFPPARTTLNWGHLLYYAFGFWLVLSNQNAYDISRANVVNTVKTDTLLQAARANEEYWKMYIICTLIWWVLRTPGQAWSIVVIYTVALFYIAYEANSHYLVFNDNRIYLDGFCGLDNNGAGLLLAMGIPTTIFCWERYRRWYRWLFLPILPVILHAILLTFSRGAMLSVLVVAPLWIFRGPDRKWKIVMATGLGAIGIALAGPAVQERFFSTGKYKEDGSAQSRFDSWNAAYKMASKEPLFGFGTRISPLFVKEYGADIQGRAIHNQYLQIAADNGFVGMGLYIGCIVFSLWGYQRVIRATKNNPHPDARHLLLTAYAMQTALLTFCVGATFLSLEAFEPQYYIIFMGFQLPLMLTMKQQAQQPTHYWVPLQAAPEPATQAVP